MLPTAKLRIIPYSDDGTGVDSLSSSLIPAIGNLGFGNGYTVQINPDSLNFSHTLVYKENQAPGTSADDRDFDHQEPMTLEFEVLFDRTGAVGGGGVAFGNEIALFTGQGVDMDINALKKVVLQYEGDIHRPKKVKIIWGKAFQIPGQLTFRGQLANLSYSYKKFNSFGIPLRASVSMSFQGVMEDKLREQIENRQSPDITHLVTVKEGDTLPMLAYKVYGNSKYYIAVAEANDLVDFRNLRAGQKLIFPPIL